MKKNILYRNLKIAYYGILILSIIIYSISLIYFKAPYYIFGLVWFYVILSLVTILLYTWLLILDIKHKKYKNLLFKLMILIAFICFFKQMSSCQTKVYEEYVEEQLKHK